jgi:hypothetical protein
VKRKLQGGEVQGGQVDISTWGQLAVRVFFSFYSLFFRVDEVKGLSRVGYFWRDSGVTVVSKRAFDCKELECEQEVVLMGLLSE